MVKWVAELKEKQEQQEKIDRLEANNQALTRNLLAIEVPKRWQEVFDQINACIETHNLLYPNNPRKQAEINLLQHSNNWFRVVAHPLGSNVVFIEVLFDPATRTITFSSDTLGGKANSSFLIDLETDSTVRIFRRGHPITPEGAAEEIVKPILSTL